MKNWFNYKGTISGKTYLFRSLIVGIPLFIVYDLLLEKNYYVGSVFYLFVMSGENGITLTIQKTL